MNDAKNNEVPHSQPPAPPAAEMSRAERAAITDEFGRRAVIGVLLALSGLPFVFYVVLPIGEFLAHDLFFGEARGTRALMMLGLGAWALLLLQLKLWVSGRTPEERRLVLRDSNGRPLTRRDVLSVAVPMLILLAYSAVEKDWAQRFAWSGNVHAAMSVAVVALAVVAAWLTYKFFGKDDDGADEPCPLAPPAPQAGATAAREEPDAPAGAAPQRCESLAYLVGRMGRDATRLDLVERGLWGLRVHVVADGARFRAGDSGVIGWPAYVSAAIFDLGQEAPVMGLAALPQAAVGVPWELLEVREMAGAEEPPPPMAAAPTSESAQEANEQWLGWLAAIAVLAMATMWLTS